MLGLCIPFLFTFYILSNLHYPISTRTSREESDGLQCLRVEKNVDTRYLCSDLSTSEVTKVRVRPTVDQVISVIQAPVQRIGVVRLPLSWPTRHYLPSEDPRSLKTFIRLRACWSAFMYVSTVT